MGWLYFAAEKRGKNNTMKMPVCVKRFLIRVAWLFSAKVEDIPRRAVQQANLRPRWKDRRRLVLMLVLVGSSSLASVVSAGCTVCDGVGGTTDLFRASAELPVNPSDLPVYQTAAVGHKTIEVKTRDMKVEDVAIARSMLTGRGYLLLNPNGTITAQGKLGTNELNSLARPVEVGGVDSYLPETEMQQ